MHSRLGAAVAEAHHFDREAVADFFRQFPFHVVRHAEHSAGSQAGADGLHHCRMAMPRHQRAEAEVVIEIVVAVEVAEMRALAFFDENRIRVISAVIAGHAERNAFQVFLVRLGRLGRAPDEGIKFFLQVGVHRGPRITQAIVTAIRLSGPD